jgi:hypothetical protein
VEDQSSKYNYEINDHQCTKGYYLANDTFPQWSTIANTKSTPNNVKQAALQENKKWIVGKNVKRRFVVLHAR